MLDDIAKGFVRIFSPPKDDVRGPGRICWETPHHGDDMALHLTLATSHPRRAALPNKICPQGPAISAN
jgi:hypothetical protein